MKQLVAIVCMMFAVFAFGAEKKPEPKKTSITESELRTMAKAKPNAKDAGTLYQVGMATNNVERKQEFFKASAACLLACGKYETYKKYVKGKLANAKAFEDSLKDKCMKCGGAGKKDLRCYVCSGKGKCPTCRGSGRLVSMGFNRPNGTKPCHRCRGGGKCPKCRGAGSTKAKCGSCAGTGKVFRESVAERVFRDTCIAIADRTAAEARAKAEAAARERKRIKEEERKRNRMVANHPCVQLWADGPYWAETNIGATSPEETGLYFWWGDAKGQMPSSGSFRAPFSKDNCPTADKSESDLKNGGWLTGGGILAPAHDAAHAHWGDSWRMPTKQDFQNLLDNCHWVWTFRNGVKGYVIRGKGAFSGESIFLPCTCNAIRTSLSRADESCNYWSSDRNSLSVDFNVGWRDVDNHFQFWVGLPIRPVTSKCNRSVSELQELTDRIKNEQEAQSEYVRGLGYELGSGSDMREAFECYRRAAELGSAEAQFKLGSLYRDGKGVKRDSQKSVAWFRKAAEQGLPIAQFSLGCCYKTGGGVKKNEFTAADWFEKAARQGYAPAQYLFGDCFDFGRGVICTSTDGNPREAVKWFRLAAEQGLADAQFRLGCCYLLGRGVYEEDLEEAIKWLGKAAAQGHDKAKELLRQYQ